ncbi:MAG: hypothetical protein WD156_08780 [Acidimicrobiia bacterium]
MNTTHARMTAEHYLDRVRALLADLPEDERSDLIQDLAAHLDEIDEREIETELGTPEEFVAEFRTMAGLDGERIQMSGLFDRLAVRADAVRRHPTVERIGVHWQHVRPVWVGIRGWLIVALPAVIWADHLAFRRFPIPQVEGSPLGGLVAVTALTALSVIAAQRTVAGKSMWRVTNGLFNAAVVWMLASSLLGGVLYTDRGVSMREDAVTHAILEDVHTILPEDLTATTPDGEPIEAVRLYDQNGQPFDVDHIRERLEGNWGYGTREGVVYFSLDGAPVDDPPDQTDNLYPSGDR